MLEIEGSQTKTKAYSSDEKSGGAFSSSGTTSVEIICSAKVPVKRYNR